MSTILCYFGGNSLSKVAGDDNLRSFGFKDGIIRNLGWKRWNPLNVCLPLFDSLGQCRCWRDGKAGIVSNEEISIRMRRQLFRLQVVTWRNEKAAPLNGSNRQLVPENCSHFNEEEMPQARNLISWMSSKYFARGSLRDIENHCMLIYNKHFDQMFWEIFRKKSFAWLNENWLDSYNAWHTTSCLFRV